MLAGRVRMPKGGSEHSRPIMGQLVEFARRAFHFLSRPFVESKRLGELPQMLPTLAKLDKRCGIVWTQSQGLVQPLNRPAEVAGALEPQRGFNAR